MKTYNEKNFSSENVTDPIIKIILKYRNYSSILTWGSMQRIIYRSFFLLRGMQRRNIKRL